MKISMVKNYQSEPESFMNVQQTRQLRLQADSLLQQLLHGRQQSEQRLAETGQRDAMKFVTGRSAYEEAIATTRCMIRDMDQLLEQMHAEVADYDTSHNELVVSGQQ